ncbi:FAD-dependent oxidoreductase [Candidatus Gracilibacteria bacterium]|nr:FAD-dependent oxidoreductase [Candidatus Gracilibacteria bacterium]MCF7898815.1 FAD-dependent oxidoreductase [Candidatus Paceibacterota bacterium]
MQKNNRTNYIVKEKIVESHDVVTLKLICDAGIPEYIAGQFITVFFDDIGNAEGKSYTISSAPSEDTLNLTVKGIGEFSNKLCSLNIGDNLEASLPYGYFYSESDNTSLIMIAGGIGVTPFRSMIADALKSNSSRKLVLFYSNKTSSDIIFGNEFIELQKTHSTFDINNYLTRQDIVPEGVKSGRITIDDIVNITKDIKDKEFLICGSIPFVRDFWKGLKEAGIPEETIYTEAFF